MAAGERLMNCIFQPWQDRDLIAQEQI